MTKLDFIAELGDKLSGLPADEIEERLNFYCEMIDDYIEDGLSEEEAVAAIGSVEAIVEQIIADVPLLSLIKAKMKRTRKLSTWEIVLLSVGSPIWIALIAAAFAVVISVYASIGAVVVSLWATFAALVGCGVGGVLGSFLFIFLGKFPAGFGLFSAGLVCSGLSILAFYGCKYTTVAMAWLTKKIALLIKKYFTKKEEK